MPHPHRSPREEAPSHLVDEPGELPVEPDEGPVVPGVPPADADDDGTPDVPR